MNTCKFKVGDHVVIEKSNIEFIEEYAGRTGVVVGYSPNPHSDTPYLIEVDDCGNIRIYCSVKCLVGSNQKIVITTDGVKYVTAKLYAGDTVKVAQDKCCPEDTFDFMVGAKMAMERLSPKKVEPPKPEYYNGKVVCVKAKYHEYWTPGKIYEIINGDVADNRGKHRGFRITCIGDARHMGDPYNEFIPLVED